MKFSAKDFFSKCDQIRRKLRIWSHLLKKSIMMTLFFGSVNDLMGDGKYRLTNFRHYNKSMNK